MLGFAEALNTYSHSSFVEQLLAVNANIISIFRMRTWSGFSRSWSQSPSHKAIQRSNMADWALSPHSNTLQCEMGEGACPLEAIAGGSNLALPLCSWAYLNKFINLSELQCLFLQSRHKHTCLQGWWWRFYDDNHGKCQSRFLKHTAYPAIFSVSFVTDVGTRKGLSLQVRILRTSPAGRVRERGR